MVVVEPRRVHASHLVVGHVRAQDRDQLVQVGRVAGGLPLVKERRQRLQAIEVEAPERVVVGIFGPGERPRERRQRVAACGPDVVEQVVRRGRVALVELGVHALLAERERRRVDGPVRDGDGGRGGDRGCRTRPPELDGGGVRPVRLGVRVPGVLERRLGDLAVAVDPVDVELDPVAERAARQPLRVAPSRRPWPLP